MTRVQKQSIGCYRVTATTHVVVRGFAPEIFAQIKQIGRRWHADYRDFATGELRRHAGIWPTLTAAIEEVEDTVQRGYLA